MKSPTTPKTSGGTQRRGGAKTEEKGVAVHSVVQCKAPAMIPMTPYTAQIERRDRAAMPTYTTAAVVSRAQSVSLECHQSKSAPAIDPAAAKWNQKPYGRRRPRSRITPMMRNRKPKKSVTTTDQVPPFEMRSVTT